MADKNFTKGTSWNSTETQTEASKTYTIPTSNKYLDRNISLTINVDTSSMPVTLDSVNLTLGTSNTSGISVSAGTTTKYATKATLTNSKKFNLDDGIYNWTFEKDSSGNVTIY